MTIFDGKLNANGEATVSEKVDFGKKAPGMLRASFLTRAFENGGDFSIDAFSKNYAPYDVFVGLRSPKSRAYGSYYTDKSITFDVATVDTQGNPVSRKRIGSKSISDQMALVVELIL